MTGEYGPKGFTVDGVIGFSWVYKTNVQGMMEFFCLLHQGRKGEQLVSVSSPTMKCTLTLVQENFRSGPQSVKDGINETFSSAMPQ